MEETNEQKIIRLQKEGLVARAYQKTKLGVGLTIISILIAFVVFWVCYSKSDINFFISIVLAFIANQVFIFVTDRIIVGLLVKKIDSQFSKK